MAYPIETKRRVQNLRRKGYSLNEIHSKTSVPKTTLSNWTYNISLSSNAKRRLAEKVARGQIVAAENKKKQTQQKLDAYLQDALEHIEKTEVNENIARLLCSLIYYCEGIKNTRSPVYFTNSDPELTRVFLALLRKSFDIDENKFRVCVHLHDYHDVEDQLAFWSKTTGVPLHQFTKPYHKKHTGKRTRDGYQGCASVRYHDTKVARQLLMTAKAFLSHSGV